MHERQHFVHRNESPYNVRLSSQPPAVTETCPAYLPPESKPETYTGGNGGMQHVAFLLNVRKPATGRPRWGHLYVEHRLDG